MKVDPIKFEVLRNGLLVVVDTATWSVDEVESARSRR